MQPTLVDCYAIDKAPGGGSAHSDCMPASYSLLTGAAAADAAPSRPHVWWKCAPLLACLAWL